MFRVIVSLIIIFIFSSCQEEFVDQESLQISGADIASELTPYFITFQQEASIHGLEIDYESASVSAEIIEINEGSVAGSCTTNGHDLRHITIDQSFWDRASPLLKEMVIFHELGHCILGRGHSEAQFENGICRSIMRSGLGGCIDAYDTPNREYYIDELFNNNQ